MPIHDDQFVGALTGDGAYSMSRALRSRDLVLGVPANKYDYVVAFDEYGRNSYVSFLTAVQMTFGPAPLRPAADQCRAVRRRRPAPLPRDARRVRFYSGPDRTDRVAVPSHLVRLVDLAVEGVAVFCRERADPLVGGRSHPSAALVRPCLGRRRRTGRRLRHSRPSDGRCLAGCDWPCGWLDSSRRHRVAAALRRRSAGGRRRRVRRW